MATKKTTKKTSTKLKANKVEKINSTVKPKKVVIEETINQNPEKVTNSTNEIKTPVEIKTPTDEELKRKLTAISVSIIIIGLFATFSFYSIPNQILSQTIDKQNAKKAEDDKKANEIARQGAQARIDLESGVLKFSDNTNWDLALNIKDFGEIKLNLKSEYAPKTVENFVRLSYREYFNNTIFHRMTKQPGFSVIQGGDAENRNGQGGKSAFYISETEPANVPDELWITEPEFTTEGENNVLTNIPEFRAPSLYTNFSPDTGGVTYKKGLILMAKTNDPDSASSQFFITLADTTLPAQYTAFGTVDPSSFVVLDKITQEINPITVNQETGAEEPGLDGRPNKELLITSLKIVNPKI